MSTSTISFVVEGTADAAILRRLLPGGLEPGRFFAASGRTGLATIARNIAVHEGGPIMIVADADTLDVDRARQDRLLLLAAVHSVSPDPRIGAFQFTPELEVVFFEAPGVLDTIRPGLSTETEAIERGRLAPKQGLRRLLGGAPDTWLHSLPEERWAELRAGKQASAFADAVRALCAQSEATSPPASGQRA